MKNILYNRQHLKEYLSYGLLFALVYIIPVWIFFLFLDYNQMWIIFIGPILAMFVVAAYVLKLARRRPEYKSSWMMIIAGHGAIITGILFSVIFTTILCFIYIPGFLSGDSSNVLKDSPAGLNNQNWSMLMLLYVCATIENFGAGGFVALLGPYVFKRNQTKDRSAFLEKETGVAKNNR